MAADNHQCVNWAEDDGCSAGGQSCERCPLPECVYHPGLNLRHPVIQKKEAKRFYRRIWETREDILVIVATDADLLSMVSVELSYAALWQRRERLRADPSLMLSGGSRSHNVNLPFNRRMWAALG